MQKSAGSTQHALHAVCVVCVHSRVLHSRLTKPARVATLAATVATTTRRQPYLFHRAPSLLRTRLFHFYTFRSPLFLFFHSEAKESARPRTASERSKRRWGGYNRAAKSPSVTSQLPTFVAAFLFRRDEGDPSSSSFAALKFFPISIIGNYKFVLFVDSFGIGPNLETILTKLLEEQNQSYEFYNECEDILEKKCIIIGSLSKLELKYNEHVYENIFRKIQELKSNENVLQLFAWISSKNVQNKILTPFLEHMSNLIVTINDGRYLTIVSKSKSSLVKSKEYYHELILGKTSIKEFKRDNVQQIIASEVSEDIENLGTFKIGQKADELEAKRNLKLPFEIM